MNRRTIIKLFLVTGVLYFLIYICKNSSTTNLIRDLQQSGRNLAEFDTQEFPFNGAEDHKYAKENLPTSTIKVVTELSAINVTESSNSIITTTETSVLDKVRIITKCIDKPLLPKTQQRGDYWVLYNYVIADKHHKCHESITYTTHADYSFLNNLIPLLEHWQGPISVALHAPGTDFKNTIDSLAYLRECTTSLVKEYVTFHIYFSTKHVPKEVGNFFFVSPILCDI